MSVQILPGAPDAPDVRAAPAWPAATSADTAATSADTAATSADTAAPPESREVQVLFREARQRRRRRWQAGIAMALATSAAVAVAAVTWLPGITGHVKGGSRPSVTAQAFRSYAAAVWWDDLGRLHVGDLGPDGRVGQRVVAEVNAAWLPLVAAGSRVYWVDPAGAFVPALGHWSQVVRYLDVRTAKIGVAGPGQTVFVSADGRYLLMSQDPSSLTETPVAGGAPRLLNLPRGWYLPGGNGTADAIEGQGLATANGIVVQSRESPGIGPRAIALWDPRTGRVRTIGRGRGGIDSYTPPGTPYSLLAWLPAACPPPGSCLIKITNTASLSTRAVRAPSAGLFAAGGAFSPGGSQLAVFATGASQQTARLALIDVATGAVRVVSRPVISLGEAFDWARWLPDGRRLIIGTGAGGDLVDSATLAARPLVIAGRNGLRTGSGQEINFTAVIVPLQR